MQRIFDIIAAILTHRLCLFSGVFSFRFLFYFSHRKFLTSFMAFGRCSPLFYTSRSIFLMHMAHKRSEPFSHKWLSYGIHQYVWSRSFFIFSLQVFSGLDARCESYSYIHDCLFSSTFFITLKDIWNQKRNCCNFKASIFDRNTKELYAADESS